MINDDVGKICLNFIDRIEVSFYIVNVNLLLDKVEDFYYFEEVFQIIRVLINLNEGFECIDYNVDKDEIFVFFVVGLLNQLIGD